MDEFYSDVKVGGGSGEAAEPRGHRERSSGRRNWLLDLHLEEIQRAETKIRVLHIGSLPTTVIPRKKHGDTEILSLELCNFCARPADLEGAGDHEFWVREEVEDWFVFTYRLPFFDEIDQFVLQYDDVVELHDLHRGEVLARLGLQHVVGRDEEGSVHKGGAVEHWS